ncbi:zeta toxin family protein [Bifidobacterium sp. SO1]|uniref:zeta toxin family protein n=1 Tax=Bifidobacterium sp. SO1 TaxID=2809029 RepID=UPI001BDCCDF5|nr:zeta toxin family protein [Bifidobacterium sp. SO1]MBT1162828.1 zeta toxin family protein [Bifidobacterium sp. SO1]
MNIDDPRYARRRWLDRIMPVVFDSVQSDSHPVTVFLGGQPAAGKTGGQDLAKGLYPDIIPIVGDDCRRYHPQYRGLLKDSPLRMPEVTARLAGIWTGMCVDHADAYGYSIIIEGTWRNPNTVLDEAKRCKELGRSTHAIIVATPPLVSRAGMIDRYCSTLLSGRGARWTPPDAHDRTVEALRSNVPLIADSQLIDRFTVTDRTGAILADSERSDDVVRAWLRRFDAPLTVNEERIILRATELAEQCRTVMASDDYERLASETDMVRRRMFPGIRSARI